MPEWLCKQLIHAYRMKDQRKIRLLNDCWFFYHDDARRDENTYWDTNKETTTDKEK